MNNYITTKVTEVHRFILNIYYFWMTQVEQCFDYLGGGGNIL